MITTVNWQYILLDGNRTIGYRVKRRTTGPPPIVDGGTDMPMADNWVSAPAPPQIYYVPDSKNFIFVFWSLNAYDPVSLQSAAQIQTGNIANDSHVGGQWTITAKAYYVWDFGTGPGPNVLQIDAFDIQAGDFIPDDFEDVNPDPTGTLTAEGNNGNIDTSNDIPGPPPSPPPLSAPPSITVTARDGLPAKKFGYWLYWPSLSPLFLSYYSNYPATVGKPNSHDIVVHHNDIVVAIAFYNEVKQSLQVPHREYIYNPWWWIETRGGLVPPPPPPWPEGLAGALALLDVANRASPRLRAKVLEIALEELSIASAELRQQIEALQKR